MNYTLEPVKNYTLEPVKQDYELEPVEESDYKLEPVEEERAPSVFRDIVLPTGKVATHTVTSMAQAPLSALEGFSKWIDEGGNYFDVAGKVMEERQKKIDEAYLATDAERKGAENVGKLFEKTFGAVPKGWKGLYTLARTGDMGKASDVVEGRESAPDISIGDVTIPVDPILGTVTEAAGIFGAGGLRSVKQRYLGATAKLKQTLDKTDFTKPAEVAQVFENVMIKERPKLKDLHEQVIKEAAAKEMDISKTDRNVTGGKSYDRIQDIVAARGKPTVIKPAEGIPESKLTSIKNSIVDQERIARGEAPIETPMRQLDPMNWDNAKKLVDEGKVNPRELAEKIDETPRNLSAEETHILLYDKIKLHNEHRKLQLEINEAVRRGDKKAELDLIDRRVVIEDSMNILDNATKKAGTEWSDTGRMRQLMATEDYSLARMLERARSDNSGKPLTNAQRQKYEVLSKQIEEANIKIQQHETTISKLRADGALKKLKNDVAKEFRQAKRTYTKQELSVEFDSLMKEFVDKSTTQLNMGLDPTMALLVGKMAKNRVRSGVITVEGIVDEIYTAAKNKGIDITHRDIMDAISGYGIKRQLSRDEVNVQLREVKRQMRLISAIEDAQQGKLPPKGSATRDAKTAEVVKYEAELKTILQEQGLDPRAEASLKAYKTRTKNKVKELEERLEKGDFTQKTRKVLEKDAEATKLGFELDELVKRYEQQRWYDSIERMNVLQKSGLVLAEAANVMRSLKASFDLSAALRQGAFISVGHPTLGLKASVDMFKAVRSGEKMYSLEQTIKQRPNYKLYKESGLDLTEISGARLKMEEVYMSALSDKIPGIAASQRAYTAFLNRLRVEAFDTLHKNLIKETKGKATLEEIKQISEYINTATGRASVGQKASALTGLNTIFFAPRLVASRFQLILGQPFWKGTTATRTIIAKEYARFFTGLAVIYGLGKLAGATVELDPRSADFGKLKYGDTRLDPLAGLSQSTVFLSRVVSGKSKSPAGLVTPVRGDLPYGYPNTADTIARFLRTKLSPAVGFGVDIATGKDVIGEPVTTESIPEKVLVPLALGDIYDVMISDEFGIPEQTALSLLCIFGMGLQTYPTKEPSRQRLMQQRYFTPEYKEIMERKKTMREMKKLTN